MPKTGQRTRSKQSEPPLNEYEIQRRERIQANNAKLQSLNVKRIAASFTNLVDSTNQKKRKGKCKTTVDEDEDYEPACSDNEDSFRGKHELHKNPALARKDNHFITKESHKRGRFIPPMSLAKFFSMNNKQQRAMVGDDALGSLSSALKVVEKAINSQQQMSDDLENMDFDDESSEAQFKKHAESENVEMDRGTYEHIYSDEEESAEANQDKPKNKRGIVYCRKLTALAPGEKLLVEFDRDGNPIGKNSSIFSFFLGEQVRNRAVCPVQVEGWNDFKPETLDHLWSCILEKSTKAKNSRASQKMPHYTGTKSYARLKQEFKDKNGRDCSRVDLLLESRKRKSNKAVDATNLTNNKHAVDEMNKLKEQRRQGLIEMTDEQIFIDVLGKISMVICVLMDEVKP